MSEIEKLADRVRVEWNAIEKLAMDYARTVPEEKLQGDAAYQKLGEVKWPWRIAIMSPLKPGPNHTRLVEFRITIEKDRRLGSAFISCLAAILRSYSKQHVVAVMDQTGQYGFTIKSEGSDDVTVADFWPGEVN